MSVVECGSGETHAREVASTLDGGDGEASAFCDYQER